jgi:hypothetical protein
VVSASTRSIWKAARLARTPPAAYRRPSSYWRDFSGARGSPFAARAPAELSTSNPVL